MKIFIFFLAFITFASFIYFCLIIIYRFQSLNLLMGKNIPSLKNQIIDFFKYVKSYLLKVNKSFTSFKRYEKIRLLIERLNLKQPLNLENFLFFEELSILLFFILGFILGGNLILGFIFGIFGYFIPEMILKEKVKQKDENILKEMPDAIDIISANIEGGTSLTNALRRYVERNQNVFAEELKIALNKINFGKSFSEALKEMDEKLNLSEITGLVNAFIQADKYGGNVKDIIKAQGDEIRAKRFQYLKKKAHEAPVKLLIPLMIFIFPVIFIVLFGPVVIKLMTGM